MSGPNDPKDPADPDQSPNASSDQTPEQRAEDARDAAWLLAQQRNESPTEPIDPARQAEYQRLEKLLTQLPKRHASEQFRAQLNDRLRANLEKSSPSGGRWRWMALAIAAVALLAIGAALLWPRPKREISGPIAKLSFSIQSAPGSRGQASIGDTVSFRFRLDAPGELRVYRTEGALVLRCPGSASCAQETADGKTVLVAKLLANAPGTYRAIGIEGEAISPPTGQGLDADLQALAKDGAKRFTVEPVDVH